LQQQVAELQHAYHSSNQQLQETRVALQQALQQPQHVAGASSLATYISWEATQLKLPKPPESNGRQPTPLNWSYKMEAYLKGQGADLCGAECIALAAAYLKDSALNWYRQFEQETDRGLHSGFANWAEFKEAFIKRFTPVDPEADARNKLDKLYQVRGAFVYAQEFNACMLELPKMEEHDRIHHFVKGLKPEVRIHVKLHDPASLSKAIELAIQADSMVWDVSRRSGTRPVMPMNRANVYRPSATIGATTTGTTSSSGGASPMELGVTEGKSKIAPRSSVVCFYCKKPGHMKRDCRKLKVNSQHAATAHPN